MGLGSVNDIRKEIDDKISKAKEYTKKLSDEEKKTGKMARVMVTAPMIGFCHCQVCAVNDATDEEILRECNQQNPAGTEKGWCEVIRELEQTRFMGKTSPKMLPGPCADYPDRTHYLVVC